MVTVGDAWLEEFPPRVVIGAEVELLPEGEWYCACCELLFELAPLPLGLRDGRRVVDEGDAFDAF